MAVEEDMLTRKYGKNGPSGMLRLRVALLAAIAAAWLFAAGGCATQEDVLVLLDRIVLLEQADQQMMDRMAQVEGRMDRLAADMEALQSDREKGEEAIQGQTAQLRAQLDALHQQVREIQGALEETGFEFTRKVDKIQGVEKKVEQTERRIRGEINTLEGRVAQMEALLGVGDQPGEQGSGGREGDASKKMSEDDMYALAKKSFDKGEFETSVKQFQAYLRRYPDSGNADNALFWIGESHFQRGWYEKAILEYQNVIEKHPNGNKVPAALLKQGMAFARIGDKNNARLIWNELIKRYSASPEAQIAKKKLAALN
ncbi:MAG: tol-pal system protein YbgF [Desulfatibacillaceae bacterium]